MTLKGYFYDYKLKKGDVVLDCGAHVGLITMYAAKIVGTKGLVIAFEPDTMNNKKLKDNIKLNNLKNVIIVKKGVWKCDTRLPFESTLSASSSFIYTKKNLTKAIGIHIGADELKEKYWYGWDEFIKELLKNNKVLLFGKDSENESKIYMMLSIVKGKGLIDKYNQLDIMGLIKHLKDVDFLICHDSGPMH
jgi:hypothetical protein